jgi:hypothetical protein
MCTKNIGLTNESFARKVGFAHIEKKGNCFRPNQPVGNRASTLSATFFKGTARNWGQRAMKPGGWKIYRTRFLVKAKQLNSNLSFVDALGRQHSGRKGDYLVESSDGVISIAPRQIFEDIYVAMTMNESSGVGQVSPFMPGAVESASIARPGNPNPGGRKQPQGCRERRGDNSSMGLM